MGVEYVQPLCNGATLAIRALMEGQYWSAASEDPDDEVRTEQDDNLGFFGFTLSAEVID